MTDYKQLNENTWNTFGKGLLEKKGSNKQKEFLRICKSGKNAFLQYMGDHLFSIDNSVFGEELITFEYKFTEREFLCPPKDTQEIIWNTFKSLSDDIMASCGFWGYIITNMIKNNHIKPEYLAANLNGINETGISVIDQALESKNNKTAGDKKIDVCVRRILRSMCNPMPRGKRVVFDDFYLGKAYWRWNWSEKMSTVVGLEFEEMLRIFDADYYGEFSAKMHSGKSYISSENVLGGLLLYLQQTDKNKLSTRNLREIIDKIAYLSAWKAIEIQDPELNQTAIQEIAKTL